MAAIEKIRKRSGLLIAIIGLALLAFVLQDLFQSTGRHREYNVAVIDGEKIPYKDFEDLKNKNLENMKRSYGNSLTSSQTYSVYNNTLEQMIKDHIMTKEYDAIGMNVTGDELYDQFVGDEPHQWVVQNFSDANGNFDRQTLENYMQQLDNAPIEYRNQWIDFENAIKENRLQTKFDNLVKASYFVPEKLAKKYYDNKNVKASAEVVALRYSTIPDSTITVTDKDNRKFYEENKYKYETDETRAIDYVVFDIKPSAQDDQDARAIVEGMKADFAATDNVASFVNANSDQRYDSTWMSRTAVPAAIEGVVFDEGNQPGFVYGPYFDNESYNLVRIVDLQNRADSLKASHILISYKGALRSEDTINTKERAQAIADSLLVVLKKNAKNTELFGELATKMSADKGSAEKGGDLDWFTDGMMVYNFNEFVMNNAVGQMGVVETPFGFHVIKVTGKTEMEPKARLAILKHDLTFSTKTYQDMFAVANKFVTENRTLDQFNATVEAEGMTKRTMPRLNASTYQITGIDNPRQIVRWAFDDKTKVGDVSSIFELDNMFVVAALTEIVPEGYAPIEKIAEQSKYQILNKKKGEVAVEKMKACGTDYDRMVSELGAESTTVNDVNLESRGVGNFGVESDIVGTIMGMKEGAVEGPIAGNTSAFVIKNVKIAGTPENVDLSSIHREKKAQFDNKVLNNGVYNALRNNAKIEDNRVLFY
ncbi:MAG: peptidylprolyl isomerase [Bacteroidales bacterium]|nr:peptidylprolyl isomerase [Bacteroidales bacterium]